MNVKKIIIVILMSIIMPGISAKALTAVEYIQKIANDAGGNQNSTSVIGNTGLAYDGTVDNNLRYVGTNPNNYIWFNDELWRIIGVMNNVKDENGNTGSYLKIVKNNPLSGVYVWDNSTYSINRGNGVNEWSTSDVSKLLNPGNENYRDPDNDNKIVNNSLYWNSESGTCIGGWYSTHDCDFTKSGLKTDFKKYIKNVVWNTGAIRSITLTANEMYNQERLPRTKCNYNNYCNDNIERTSSFIGKVGLPSASDASFSAWIGRGHSSWTITPLDNNSSGYMVIYVYTYYNERKISTLEAVSYYPYINPTIYLENNMKIISGDGSNYNPYILKDENYEINENTIQKTNGKYKGNYSIDYLTKNYNIITFGTKSNNLESDIKAKITEKGNVENISKIEGSILVEKDLTSNVGQSTLITKDNESFIKGNIGKNYSITSKIIQNKDYVDFDKMYAQITNEQQQLVDNTEYNVNKETIQITKPGIYMINNSSSVFDTSLYKDFNDYQSYYSLNSIVTKRIYIDNYDKDNYYIINNMKIFEYNNYDIYIKSSSDPAFYTFNSFVKTGNYSGNIIFNYPNARYMELTNVSGKIIAPKADIYLKSFSSDYNTGIKQEINDSIFANSIKGENITMNYYPNILDKKILDVEKQYTFEPTDYNDDLYTYDYSIKSLLENYSVVSLGKKKLDEKSKFYELNNVRNGNVGIFHIAGQFLINGNLAPTSETPSTTGYWNSTRNAVRIDKESNLITESYVSGNISSFVSKYWTLQGNKPIYGSTNPLYLNANNDNNNNNSINELDYLYSSWYGLRANNEIRNPQEQFINFDRLYDNIIAEQKEIDEGKTLTADSDGVLHIPTGGIYTIEDISNVEEIVFDNFEKNKDELTIISIKDTGDIDFPKINTDTIGLIETNDYYGKETATYQYEIDRDFDDKYHGNIVWSVPNATYIQLAANAPFAGHLIAPNADVETPEMHFSGCFIVNSLYCEGNTEAHFYPLTIKLDCINGEYKGMSEDQKLRFSEYRLSKMLGGDGSIIEKKVVGDREQYKQELELFEKTLETCDTPRIIIVNPKTAGTIAILFGIISLAFIGLFLRKKKVQ